MLAHHTAGVAWIVFSVRQSGIPLEGIAAVSPCGDPRAERARRRWWRQRSPRVSALMVEPISQDARDGVGAVRQGTGVGALLRKHIDASCAGAHPDHHASYGRFAAHRSELGLALLVAAPVGAGLI